MRITSVATTYQEPKTTLAEQLKRLRQAKGHPTARGFAKTLGISENRYSRYERGEAVPKLDLVWSICSTLGITPNELYGWESPSIHPTPAVTRPPGLPAQTLPASSMPAPGMADEPVTFLHQPPSQSATTAKVAWRLASALAEAAEPAGGSKMRTIRATAEFYSKLTADPFETIATCLQALNLDTSKPAIEARLADEVEAFLAALDANGALDPQNAR